MTEQTNLLLIGVDSLRADHMSCYGYHRLTTPHIDEIARRGTLFQNAFSPHIPTIPGYTSMLSGTDVIGNQAVSLAPKSPLDPSIKLLPEILRERGYESACVGFDDSFFRGFNHYRTYHQWMSWEDAPGHKAEELNKEALPLLESMADGPFFLFLRHMDPHTPYLPPEPFSQLFYDSDPCASKEDSMKPAFALESFREFFKSWMPPGIRDAEWVVAQYDSSLAYMDACMRRIVTRLEELDLIERTLVVITSDHGETLTEHGIYFDHHGLYEPTIRIPLIYHLPDVIPAGRRLDGIVLQQDLVPTVLEIMGIGTESIRSDGRSAFPETVGETSPARSEFYLTECAWMRKRGWRTPHYKLIQALEPDLHGKPEVELYDLVEDPAEEHNIAEDSPEVVASLRSRMEKWVSRRSSESGRPDPILGTRPSFLVAGSRMRILRAQGDRSERR